MPEDGFPGGKLADNEEGLQGCYPCLWEGKKSARVCISHGLCEGEGDVVGGE